MRRYCACWSQLSGISLLEFDTAVISGATHSLTTLFKLSPGELGITVFAGLRGTAAEALAAGALGRRLGARTSLFILAACYLVSALGCASSAAWLRILLFHFIGGLGMGAPQSSLRFTSLRSPPSARGRLILAFQINIITGILLAYLSNCLLGMVLILKLHRYQSALLVLIVGYVAFFAFSQGAAIWVYLCEIFPNQVRAPRAKPRLLNSLDHERIDFGGLAITRC